jgi:ribose 5-phosphate isomerase A
VTTASGDAVDAERRLAGERAAEEVVPGMRLGLGTGRAAGHFMRALARRIRAGLAVTGVPTSEATRTLAAELGIPLKTLDETPDLDLVVDGADEIDERRRLVKGGGGALLREKIVWSAARRVIVVAEAAKRVATLGAFPLPVEVTPFGLPVTLRAIERLAARLGLSGKLQVRERDGRPFVTDGGNHIVDASFGRIPAPDTLAAELNQIPGVVENGLFIGFPVTAIIARGDRVEWLTS